MVDRAIYSKPWFVYIAECRDSTLYVGVAIDPDKRIEVHNKTKSCRYTRFRKPLQLCYREMCDSYNSARKRESQIKRFGRAKKLALILSYSCPN
ncbi:MAG: GIY-YIG nuclease family protein [Candidatus Omnitrophica bacterium]|nr:GIY-YIG nuclease family protein [Candidatus Omnitrophota bacterium]